jgi:hypothetical protein
MRYIISPLLACGVGGGVEVVSHSTENRYMLEIRIYYPVSKNKLYLENTV